MNTNLFNVFIKNQFNELFTNFKKKRLFEEKVIEEKDEMNLLTYIW